MKRPSIFCRSIFLFSSALLLSAAASALAAAAEPAAKPEARAEPIPSPESVVPKRQLEFDQSEEESPILVRTPRGPAYRAVLTVEFRFPTGARSTSTGDFLDRLAGTAQAEVYIMKREGYAGLVGRLQQKAERFGWKTTSPETLASLNNQPEDMARPAPTGFGAVISSTGLHFRKLEVRFWLIAQTAEQAKAMVHTLLSLLDYGFSYPKFLEIDDLRREPMRLKEAQDKLAVIQNELESLKGYEDVSEAALVNFRSQQRLIAVDLAGIKARIEACDKILKDRGKLSPSRVEQVETVKTTAEIELVGVAARKGAIEEIVTKGARRLALTAQAVAARGNVRRTEGWVEEIDAVEAAARTVREEKMLFGQVQGKVVIRRVKWETPNAKPRPDNPSKASGTPGPRK